MESDDEDFQVKRSTLIDDLKNILEQYDDRNQILKEIIQNAEDAKARVVKFVYDQKTYGKNPDQLLENDTRLVEYQGPALYAYNDAVFDNDDWDGVRSLRMSHKKLDAEKIGRFGLGFKSVFHLTDFPSVLSGNHIGIIDPTETHSKRFELKHRQKLIEEKHHQFSVYQELFECNETSFKSGYFNGTIFRLPLRKKVTASSVSPTTYSKEDIHRMFKAFTTDAHLLLLFLRHIEQIELYVREKKSSEPELLFSVNVCEQSLVHSREARNVVYNSVAPSTLPDQEVQSSYDLWVCRTAKTPDGSKETIFKWLVTNYCLGEDEASEKLKQLVLMDALKKSRPIVSVAMITNPDDIDGNVVAVTKRAEEPRGHVFCFIPLPLETESMTGLPVHVNGYFQVDQNRRHLKWPTMDQVANKGADDVTIWNVCLVEEVIPRAIAVLLENASGVVNTNVSGVTKDVIYQMVPNKVKVDERWKESLTHLQLALESKRILHTEACGGQWIKSSEAIFDENLKHDDRHKAINNALRDANTPIVQVPEHVLHFMKPETVITPSLVRDAIRCIHQTCTNEYTREDKIHLLSYILQDGNYSDLDRLHLLPLADGTFKAFSTKSNADRIYIASEEHPMSLLPNMESHFLDPKLDADTMKHLRNSASQGTCQLAVLTPDVVASLLRDSLPPNWFGKDEVIWNHEDSRLGVDPKKEWLEQVWQYLTIHFHDDLKPVHELPILPKSCVEAETRLMPLKSNHGVIEDSGNFYLDPIRKSLDLLGVRVVDELPEYVRNHPLVMADYVTLPTVNGLLSCLETSVTASKIDLLDVFNQKSSPTDRLALREYLSKGNEKDFACAQTREIISGLKLFKSLGQESFVCLRDVPRVAPVEDLPPVLPKTQMLIDVSSQDARNLTTLLGVEEVNCLYLLTNYVFVDLKAHKYTPSEIEAIVTHSLALLHLWKTEDRGEVLKIALREMPFQKVAGDVVLKRPCEMFDPDDDLLKKLFRNTPATFPTGVYMQPDNLAALKILGLKTSAELVASDLILVAKELDAVSTISETFEQKSKSLMHVVNKMMSKKCHGPNELALKSSLGDVCWVLPLRRDKKSDDFPLELVKPETVFCKPTEVRSCSLLRQLGCVSILTDDDFRKGSPVAEVFGWLRAPSALELFNQLKCLVRDHKKLKSSHLYVPIIHEVYSCLNAFGSGDIKQASTDSELRDWIWNGSGFVSKEKMVVCNDSNICLIPYLWVVPNEMLKYSHLFFKSGIVGPLTSEHLVGVLEQMKEKHDRTSGGNAKRTASDLKLAISILQELTSNFVFDGDLSKRILLPVETGAGSDVLKLVPLSDCTYCDVDWMMTGKQSNSHSEGVSIAMVHRNIPLKTITDLKVETLMSRIVHTDPFPSIEAWGQSESITARLRGLVERDYVDGFSVIKELVQNADDAGATEVKILYDERMNVDAREKLLDPAMGECQGASLWIYNDAVFSNDDFVNITKLSGATKQHDSTKIGTFGLGFNAVYNITDVPGFISRDEIAIFDPHNKYIGRVSKQSGGVRLKMRENRALLQELDQFKPFENVFGCKLKEEWYPGTLFRLPLRTASQQSEICDTVYNKQEVSSLLQKIAKSAGIFLLFTQNVLKFSVHHMDKSGKESSLLDVEKSCVNTLSSLQFDFEPSGPSKSLHPATQEFIKNNNILKAVEQAVQHTSKAVPVSSAIVMMKVHVTSVGHDFLSPMKAKHSKTPWLVTSTMGTNNSLIDASSDSNKAKSPAAGVAIMLKRINDGYIPLFRKDKTYGRIFCFLPLPIESGLPFHINASFSVESDRRSLRRVGEGDKNTADTLWNTLLLTDAVTSALVHSCEYLKSLIPSSSDSCCIYDIFPKIPAQKEYSDFVASFYRRVVDENKCFFTNGNYKTWIPLDTSVFLEEHLHICSIRPIVIEVLNIYHENQKTVVVLPSSIVRSIKSTELQPSIKNKGYSTERFFEEVFKGLVNELPSSDRDSLALFALDQVSKGNKTIESLMKDTACIPSTPYGSVLKFPRELVNPFSSVACLYSPCDAMFPHGQGTFEDPKYESPLCKLGMKSDLTWRDIMERSYTINELYQKSDENALQRAEHVLHLIDRKLKPTYYSTEDVCSQQEREEFQLVPFLPVLTKAPNHCTLPWKESAPLCSASMIYTDHNRRLLSAISPILGTLVGDKTLEFFNLLNKSVPIKDVIQQLFAVIDSYQKDELPLEECRKTVCEIYSYLGKHLEGNQSLISEKLKGKSVIIIGDKFVEASQVSRKTKLTHDCSPYLFNLPAELRSNTDLLTFLGAKEQFDASDFVACLRSMKNKVGNLPLQEEQLQLTIRLATIVDRLLGDYKQENLEKIYLPDKECILFPADELCFDDCKWLKRQGKHFIHPGITLRNLGVQTQRQRQLKDYSVDFSFGQIVETKSVIKRVLENNPFDKEVLKEMIQNADDAGATEIHFILDKRTHPSNSILETSWEPLQGPALCVYNNKPFTEHDIKSIMKLGIGGKQNDPQSIGQFGVGFTTLYHLTDAPSFVTSIDGKQPVLCIFDPNALYAPGANLESGGMGYNAECLREEFPDTMNCYLGDFYELGSGTMFRFPLRTKDMAVHSEVSKNPVDHTYVEAILDQLQTEINHLLLFTRNLKKIAVSHIDSWAKKPTSDLELTVAYHPEDRKREFYNYVDTISKQLQSNPLSIRSTRTTSVAYDVHVTVKDKNKSCVLKWLVCQRVGCENADAVPESIYTAFDQKDINLLPIGGVATPIECAGMSNKVFCYLPLRLEKSKVQICVQGHFAFGTDNRRMLSFNDPGYRSSWNIFLQEEIISEAYINLLQNALSRRLTSPTMYDYFRLFPQMAHFSTEWKALVNAVYTRICSRSLKLFPIKSTSGTWEQVSVTGDVIGYFNNLRDQVDPKETMYGQFNSSSPKPESESLADILVKTGFLMISCSKGIYQEMERMKLPASCVSPSNVIEFLKVEAVCSRVCGQLIQTPFGNAENVCRIIRYLQRDKEFRLKAEGLPILLTEDGSIRRLSKADRTYISDYYGIVPKFSAKFLHNSCHTLFSKDDMKCFFDKFDLQAFSKMLPCTMPNSMQCGEDEYVWHPHNPPEHWVARVWSFIRHTLDHTHCASGKSTTSKLSPLSKWPLIPARVGTNTYLVPIENALHVFARKYGTLSVYGYGYISIYEIAIKYGCMELSDKVCSKYSTEEILSTICCQYTKPSDVVRLLSKNLSAKTIGETHCRTLVEYFSDRLAEIRREGCSEMQSMLRSLPIYETITGSIIPINDSQVIILPNGLPTDGIDTWQNKKGLVFLAGCKKRDELYKFIGGKQEGLSFVYCTFILPMLNMFDNPSRFKHLYFVYEICIGKSVMNVSKVDVQNLKAKLKGLQFITPPDEDVYDGDLFDPSVELLPASEFFDPGNAVFSAMLSEEEFPPKAQPPFTQQHWQRFLEMTGLVTEVDEDTFLEFARQIEVEFRRGKGDCSVTKSEILVAYLFDNQKHLHSEHFLKKVKSVKFIPALEINRQLSDIHPQYGSGDPFICFDESIPSSENALVWSVANLLPVWANPYGVDNELRKHLQVVANPSPELVAEHCTRLVWSFHKRQSTILQEVKDAPGTMKTCLKEIFRFLSSKLEERKIGDVFADLRSSPCIPVENGRRVVFPNQVVVNIMPEDELKPCLYKLPSHLGEFVDLFKLLGVFETATAELYAGILQQMHRQSSGAHLTPAEFEICKKATFHLFTIISANTSLYPDIEELYLLSHKGILKQARNMNFGDVPSFTSRLHEFGKSFVLDMRLCGLASIDVKSLFKQLPKHARPHLLSDIVSECRVTETGSSPNSNRIAESLAFKLHSDEFASAFLRLLQHEEIRQNGHPNSTLEYVTSKLKVIEIRAVEELKTVLKHKNVAIPGSEQNKECFVERNNHTPVIYVHNCDDNLSDVLAITLAEVLSELTDGVLNQSCLYLIPLLREPLESLHLVLDALNVHSTVDRSYDYDTPGLICSGATLHADLEKFLIPNPSNVGDGEILVYQGNTSDGELCYVYGRFLGYAADGWSHYNIETREGVAGIPREDVFRCERAAS